MTIDYTKPSRGLQIVECKLPAHVVRYEVVAERGYLAVGRLLPANAYSVIHLPTGLRVLPFRYSAKIKAIRALRSVVRVPGIDWNFGHNWTPQQLARDGRTGVRNKRWQQAREAMKASGLFNGTGNE